MYQKNAQNLNGKLAKECRKALEKNYGGAVPMPEYLTKRVSPKKRAKRARLKKRSKLSVKVAVIHYKIDLFAPMRIWIAQKNTQNLSNTSARACGF